MVTFLTFLQHQPKPIFLNVDFSQRSSSSPSKFVSFLTTIFNVKTLKSTFLIGLGYMLSPLSWWNDLFFNLPIAYGLGYAIGWAYPQAFLPATIVGYWLSNVLGILMMQTGMLDFVISDPSRSRQRELWIGLGSSTLYTLIIVGLVYWHILELPEFLLP